MSLNEMKLLFTVVSADRDQVVLVTFHAVDLAVAGHVDAQLVLAALHVAGTPRLN